MYKIDKEEGKEATTSFTRLSYNGKTSVVQCKYDGTTEYMYLYYK